MNTHLDSYWAGIVVWALGIALASAAAVSVSDAPAAAALLIVTWLALLLPDALDTVRRRDR